MHRVRSSPAVGNLSTLLDSADGSLDAKYEYGAFGEPLRVGGTTIADDNPFRFSTKYLDSESGLIYYGFRYYSPSLGRFLNRDPLGELGGSNLYGFIENDPVNGWDYLGLDDELVCDPAESAAGLCDDGQNSDDEDIEELDPYEVIEKRRKWRGPSGYPKAPIDRSIGIDTNFPVRNPSNPFGGGGGNGGGSGGGSGGNGSDGCDEEKEWKPNKEDCAELAKVWGRFINSTPHETRFDSQDEAAIAALFHTMLNFDTTKVEYGGNIYSDWSLWKTPSLHFGTYHFLSTPQELKKYGGSIKRDVTIWQTIETHYHTHIINEPGSDWFSPTDKYAAWHFGKVYMGNETGTMKVWITKGTPSNVKVSYDIFGGRNVERGHFPGYSDSIEGAPTKAIYQMIKKCRDEGYL